MSTKFFNPLFVLFLIALFLFSACTKPDFSGQDAYDSIRKQLEFGPRIPGSKNASLFRSYLSEQLSELGWIVEKQNFEYKNVELTNIIAKNSNNPPDVILGTHYDTRRYSDQESETINRYKPVPGANDGASGTATLLELASLFNNYPLNIWLVFFDAEDQGKINGWEWSIGSKYFVDSLNVIPKSVIIIDMVADSDLRIFRESNSTTSLSDAIWKSAENIGYADIFIDEVKYAIIDDHMPFINKGIDAVLIIDMDYQYWHTTSDILSNVSAKSLEIIGSVIVEYLNNFPAY